MVLNAYSYHEKCFTKVDLNNPFYQTEFQRMFPLNREKSREKFFIRKKESCRKKVLEGIKADVVVSGPLVGSGS